MEIKEKVIRKSIKIIEAKIKKIDDYLNEDLVQKVISLRQSISESLEDERNKPTEKRNYAETMKLIDEAKALDLKIKSRNPDKTLLKIKQKAKLESELYDLKSELYWIEQKKK